MPKSSLFHSDSNSSELIARLNFVYTGQDDFTKDYRLYTEGYRFCAELIIETLFKESKKYKHKRDCIAFPILFLYRHHIELQLKYIISNARAIQGKSEESFHHHEISTLWKVAEKLMKEIWDKYPPPDELSVAAYYINQLSEIDPKSFSFRYCVDKKGSSSLPKDLPDIDLLHLKECMQKFLPFLSQVSYGLDCMLEEKR